MPAMLNLADIFKLLVDRLDNRAFALPTLRDRYCQGEGQLRAVCPDHG